MMQPQKQTLNRSLIDLRRMTTEATALLKRHGRGTVTTNPVYKDADGVLRMGQTVTRPLTTDERWVLTEQMETCVSHMEMQALHVASQLRQLCAAEQANLQNEVIEKRGSECL
jgi:hypothetical protein